MFSADRPPPHSGTVGRQRSSAYANGAPRPNPNPIALSHRIASHRIAIAVCSHSFVWPSTALVGYHLVPPVKGSYSIRSCLFMYSADGRCRMGTSRLQAVRPHCSASVLLSKRFRSQADVRRPSDGPARVGVVRHVAQLCEHDRRARRYRAQRVCTSQWCATVAPLISEFQHTIGTTVRSTTAVEYSNGAVMTEACPCQGRHCL